MIFIVWNYYVKFKIAVSWEIFESLSFGIKLKS
jgi:hypothetical protein